MAPTGLDRSAMALVLAIAATVALPAQVWAAGRSAVRAGAATATVTRPIRLLHGTGTGTQRLAFGQITAGTGGGSVSVSATGAGSVSGDVRLIPGTTTTADAFRVQGDPLRSFAIATGGGVVRSGTRQMAFVTVPSAGAGLLNAAGRSTFTVGGTLTVPGNAVRGTYTGTYQATVTYN